MHACIISCLRIFYDLPGRVWQDEAEQLAMRKAQEEKK